jgi:hypothetical protein
MPLVSAVESARATLDSGHVFPGQCGFFYLRFVLNKICGMDVDRARVVEKFLRLVDSRCNVIIFFSKNQGDFAIMLWVIPLEIDSDSANLEAASSSRIQWFIFT